jgi:hypothetical protein
MFGSFFKKRNPFRLATSFDHPNTKPVMSPWFFWPTLFTSNIYFFIISVFQCLRSFINLNIEVQIYFNIIPLVIAPVSLLLVFCDDNDDDDNNNNNTCSLSFFNFKLLKIILSSGSINMMEKWNPHLFSGFTAAGNADHVEFALWVDHKHF